MTTDQTPHDPERRRALVWEKARARIALIDAVKNHAGHLRARALHLAAGARMAMAADAHPGRGWWARQHRDCMNKAHNGWRTAP